MKASQVKAGQIAAATPQLGRGLSACQQEIDLSGVSYSIFRFETQYLTLFGLQMRLLAKSHPRMQSAKLKALRLVQLKGPLQASDPNSPSQKPKTPEMQAKVRKRVLNASDTDGGEEATDSGHVDTPRPPKRTKLEMDKLLEAKSSHSHLIDEFEAEQSELYFSKLEKKEQMETKMLDTFDSCSGRIRYLGALQDE